MNKNDKILKFYLEKFEFSINKDKVPKHLSKHGISYNEILNVLQKVKLIDSKDRMEYIWTLDNVIDNVIIDNIFELDESKINNMIFNEMVKLYPLVKIDENIFTDILKNRSIISSNSMKALYSIYEGNLENFNSYDESRGRILFRYIVKLLVLLDIDKNDLTNDFIDVKSLIDRRNNYIIHKILNNEWYNKSTFENFKSFMSDKELKCKDGVLKILKENIKDKYEYDRIFNYDKTKQQNEIQICNCDLLEKNILEDSVLNKDIDTKLLLKKNLEESLKLIDLLETKNDESNNLEIINSQLQEENRILKERLSNFESRKQTTTLKEFIQKIGGKEYNYQLSELYILSRDNSNNNELNNLSGRIGNLFSLLEMFNIEIYTAGKNLNEEFEISLKELGKNFTLDSMIEGKSEFVKVKMINYGWKQENDIIVLPLVKQI